MKTFREYLEGREVNESFFRNAALAGAGANKAKIATGRKISQRDWSTLRL